MHGSILPKMIVPLFFVGAWATTITLISHNIRNRKPAPPTPLPRLENRPQKRGSLTDPTTVGIDSILLTVTGFVVGLSLSFRSSTAYERYAEGRRYWAQVILASQNMGRVFWVHSRETEADAEKIKLHLLHSM